MEHEQDEQDEQHEDGPQEDSARPDKGSESGGDGEVAGTVEEREAIARDEDGPFD